MDPVSLLMAYLLVEAVSSGAFTSAVAGAAGGALRAAWLGGGSTGSGGGSKSKGSTKTKPSTGRSGGHIRRGAADGFNRGRAEAAERRRQRRERVRGWWRGQQAKRRERAEDPTRRRGDPDGKHCPWQTSSYYLHPYYQRFCGRPLSPGQELCDEHEAYRAKNYNDNGSPDRTVRFGDKMRHPIDELKCWGRLAGGLVTRSPLPIRQRWREFSGDIRTWSEPAYTGCCGCGRRTVDVEEPESGEQYCWRCRNGVDRHVRRSGQDPVDWRMIPADERNIADPPTDPEGDSADPADPAPPGAPSLIPTQTPPAGPVSGESPKEGTRMADVSATQSVTFWEDIADQVSRQVEAEQSAELAVDGAADVKDKIRGHAQQVADEFSGLIEAAKGSSHEYASTYRS